jgi:hypothetical protein
MTFSKTLLLLFSALAAGSASACDLCAIYNIADLHGSASGVRLGISTQFTHFGTLQQDGSEIGNPKGQRLDSAITQLLLGYNFTERFGLQLSVPFIYREFRRPEGDIMRNDETAGIGDVSLIANYVFLRHTSEKLNVVWSGFAGVKFPTGSTRRLAEETREDHHHGAGVPAAETEHEEAEEGHVHDEHEADHEVAAARRRHLVHAGEVHETPSDAASAEVGLPESGIHGHDLSLGSGSWDGLIGTSLFVQSRRAFFSGTVQYAIRSEGDYDYRYANDLIWSGGPGIFLVLEEDFTIAIQANCSGEHKPRDRFRGSRSEDTGITAVYLGPEVSATWKDRVSINVGADFPVHIDNTALQIVPDYRLRAAVTVRF